MSGSCSLVRWRSPRSARSRLAILAVVGAAAFLTLAGSALAAPTTDLEPNDNLFQAQPVLSADGVAGQLPTREDIDEYMLSLRPQRQIKITLALAPGSPVYCDVFARVTGPEGPTRLATLEADGGDAPPQESALVTTPGIVGDPVSAYLVRIENSVAGDAGCSYSLTVVGATGGQTDAVDTTPPAVVPVVSAGEPNDLPAQALGPINTDSLYEGAIETNGDVDYLVVPLKGGTKASVVLSAALGDASVSLLNSKNELLDSKSVDYDERGTLSFTAPGDEPVFIKLSGDTGARWRLRLLPGAVFPSPPAPKLAPVRAVPSLVRVRGRRLVVRLRLPQAGKLRVVLIGKGRRIEVARLTARGPRTVTLGFRRPASMRKGRYRLEATFRAAGRPAGVIRRSVVFR